MLRADFLNAQLTGDWSAGTIAQGVEPFISGWLPPNSTAQSDVWGELPSSIESHASIDLLWWPLHGLAD